MRMRMWMAAATGVLMLAGCGRSDNAKPAAPTATAAPAPAASGPLGLPTRRAGLWEQTLSRDGAPIAVTGKMRVCLAPAAGGGLTALEGKAEKGPCAKPVIVHQPDGSLLVTSSCNLGQEGSIATRGIVSGDFNTHYRVQQETDIKGSDMPAMNGHHVVVMDLVWLGPCPPGMDTGDVIMANGMKINAAKAAAAAAMLKGGG
jgi:hypothetical protein